MNFGGRPGLAASSTGARELERGLDRVRAAVGEEHRADAVGLHQPHQPGGQLDRARMRRATEGVVEGQPRRAARPTASRISRGRSRGWRSTARRRRRPCGGRRCPRSSCPRRARATSGGVSCMAFGCAIGCHRRALAAFSSATVIFFMLRVPRRRDAAAPRSPPPARQRRAGRELHLQAGLEGAGDVADLVGADEQDARGGSRIASTASA